MTEELPFDGEIKPGRDQDLDEWLHTTSGERRRRCRLVDRRAGCVSGGETLRALSPETPEDKRGDDEIQQCAREEAAKDDDGDRMQDFTARLVGGDDQRNEGEPGR